MSRKLLLALALALLAALPARAQVPDLTEFRYDQRVGAQLPLDARLRDETGRAVRLGDLLTGKPAILALNYFHCPNICGVVRDDMLNALSRSGLRTPDEYTLLVLSIDPHETSADAAAAKRQDLARFPTPGAGRGWDYLTGEEGQVQEVARSAGFNQRFVPALKQFIHPAGIVFLSPKGRISSYLLGVGYQPGDLNLAMLRARSGGFLRAALPVLLICFQHDAVTGRYTLVLERLIGIVCGLFALAWGLVLLWLWLGPRRRRVA